jgi:hypothetical protein
MASITRIQLANYLTEGYVGGSGMEWMPLYRGETLRLFGQSAALQIDNGCGKTSLTEACLYLLSQDRRLKKRVEERVAPLDKGWSHVRIEFIEKPHEDNILQSSLITVLPDEVPGTPYVIGLCWNRGKDPYFYHYQGLLEDAECFLKTEDKLELIDNAAFKKSVEKIPGSHWNIWRNIAEWQDEIRYFTNVEVIKQNVEFQVEGAGDYSAMVTNVKPQNGETYDAAFFRQCVAPELLKQPLGEEGEAHEQKFEEALFATLKPTADALVDINRKQQELNDATDAINKFQPVEEKAQEIIQADSDYNNELTKVVQEAAVIHAIAVKSPIPGIPVIPANPQWISDKKVLEALSHLVIDKREGVLITDEGLAKLISIEVKRVNEKAVEGKVQSVIASSQPIELKGDLKDIANKNNKGSELDDSMQPVDSKDDHKGILRGKHRKYATTCYDLVSALLLVNATANISGAHTEGLRDILTRAFDIATTELDTNPYRKEKRKLSAEREIFRKTQNAEKTNQAHWQEKYEELQRASRETTENQVAYEIFAARKQEFPEEYWLVPLRAQEWAVKAKESSKKKHDEHIGRAGLFNNDFALWNELKAKHGLITLPSALEDLNKAFRTAHEQDRNAKQALTEARGNYRQLSDQLSKKKSRLETSERQHKTLSGLAASMPTFQEIFGAVDPETLNPQKSLKDANQSAAAKESEMNKANSAQSVFDALIPRVATFQKIFGEVDPSTLNPTKALTDHKDKISTEQQIMDGELPYFEALNIFQETFPNQTPDEWLKETADVRNNLGNEKRENTKRVEGLEKELGDLDKFAVADNRVYSNALDELQAEGVPFERLHETITQAVKGSRRQQLLSLFSGALSAPVVSTLDDADRATKILEAARLTVPVFFKPTLSQFVQQGEVTLDGAIAYTILVGRHTRQVEILLNPDLIEEEKSRIQADIQTHSLRNKEIDKELAKVSEESQPVKLAVSAKDAIKRGSEKTFNAAKAQLEMMNAELADFEFRASSAAINSIEAMKQYRNAGGEKSYNELVEIISRLVSEKRIIEELIETLNVQVTEVANRALHAAKDYKKLGGDTELNRLAHDIEILGPEVEVLKSQVEEIDRSIREVLEGASEVWAQKLGKLNETYSIDKRHLETAIAFEEAGSVEFMQQESTVRQKLIGDLDVAQRRLENIDFKRANSYIQATRVEERSLADQLAEAEHERDQAGIKGYEAERQVNNLSGQISTLIHFVEAIHEMVVVIRSQNSKIVHFSDDIRQRMQRDGAVHPEILGYVEDLHLACLGDRASTSDATRATIANLKVEVEELEIDTKQLLNLSNACAKARRDFGEKRKEFCDKVRKEEIKGLHTLEIEEIEKANTLEQLISIHALKGKIEAQIREHEANLKIFISTMESNKSATVDSLARFARNAKINLAILDKVMKRRPDARFIIQAEMASEERIQQIISSLIADIEDRERAARERSGPALNSDIESRNKTYKELINFKIYHDIFIDPKVTFIHTSIYAGRESPLTAPGAGLSTGQHTALAMMWLVRQAEYAQARVVAMSGTRKEQQAAMKGSHRIMFFDGLFSNLSNEGFIDTAFEGLKDVGDNFQLIGLIHNPYYVNNKDIFPAHLVGKRKMAKSNEKERFFVAVEEWQKDNGVIVYTSAYKHNPDSDHAKA